MAKSSSTIERIMEEIVVILSEDVLVEILARLPVKSLMRFKCVCKSWYCFISDPIFIRKHFLHYTNNPDNSGHLLVVGERHSLQGLACSLISFHDDTFSNQFALCDIPSKIETVLLKDFRGTDHSSFSYSCHGFGIVCFRNHTYGDLALWNPATREFRILPELPEPILRIPPHTSDYYVPYMWCGLGFDSIHDDYKLVHFGYGQIDNSIYIEEEPVTLYTFSTNSWKTLDVKFNGRPCPPGDNNAAYINGFPWWFAREDENPAFYVPEDRGYDFIASFDVNAEIFRYYQLPECCRGFRENYYSLIQLHSSVALCLCLQDHELGQDMSFDIWLMEEFGVEVTWTKFFSVGPFQRVDYARVTGLWPSSNILVMQLASNRLTLCDFTTSKTEQFELEVPTGVDWSNVHVFCDSVVHVGGKIEL